MELHMNLNSLVVAGVAGMIISVVHGYLGQVLILQSIAGLPTLSKRINWAVFQLSSVYWFFGGLALALAPFLATPAVQSCIVFAVAAMYLVGAAANFIASRGRHFGWVALSAIAILALVGSTS